jgi:hypothetical protein
MVSFNIIHKEVFLLDHRTPIYISLATPFTEKPVKIEDAVEGPWMTVKVVLVLLQRKAITQLQDLRGGREQRSSLVYNQNRKKF